MEAPCSRFTAAEGGARLAVTAGSKNTLAAEYASFISTRMIYEDAFKIRGSLFDGCQRSVYVTRATRVEVVAYELNILTDLKITKAVKYDDVYDWHAEMDVKEVLVCTSEVIKRILEDGILMMESINILVIDSSHLICKDECLQYLMRIYKECEEENRPRILALTYPLFTHPKKEVTNNSRNESIPSSHENLLAIDEKGDTESKTDNTENLLENKESENLPKESEINETVLKKEIIVPKEEIIVPKVDITVPEEKIIVPKEEIIVPKEDIIVPKENIIVLKEEITATADTDPDLQDNKDVSTKKDVELEPIGVYENLDDFDMYEKLEWKIEQLEKELCSQMDLAEDIDGGKRLSGTIVKPKEVIIEHGGHPNPDELPQAYVQLDKYMRQTVDEAMAFLNEHRYDPTEIYGEDMYEEFMNIPDPTIEPKQIFKQFIYVLDQLGPYAADKAAFSLLTKLEKLKIKVPYERHFLLLCLCTSIFVKIRCYTDMIFSKYESDWEKIKMFCTPKVLRFAEILEKFCPIELIKEHLAMTEHSKVTKKSDHETQRSKTNELLHAIEKCDFISLANKIEDKVNTLEANLKDLDIVTTEHKEIDVNIDNNTTDQNRTVEEPVDETKCTKTNLESTTTENNNQNGANNTVTEDMSTGTLNINTGTITNNNGTVNNNTGTVSNNSGAENVKSTPQSPQKTVDHKGGLGFHKRQGHRPRGRGRTQRPNQARTQQIQQNPDALCGIVFMKEALMAKIMFMLIVDMSRSNPKLSFICSQYCAVEKPADPGTELKECQRQGKKQEDVLKKFRMHECNLLLATSALEEGIDLPRCNLVLRWDVPASYRSYGLCRSRARAPRASCALLACAGTSDTRTLLHNVAVYRELDQIITRKCGCGIQDEPSQTEENHADIATQLVKSYTPHETTITTNNNDNNTKHETETTTDTDKERSDIRHRVETKNYNENNDTRYETEITTAADEETSDIAHGLETTNYNENKDTRHGTEITTDTDKEKSYIRHGVVTTNKNKNNNIRHETEITTNADNGSSDIVHVVETTNQNKDTRHGTDKTARNTDKNENAGHETNIKLAQNCDSQSVKEKSDNKNCYSQTEPVTTIVNKVEVNSENKLNKNSDNNLVRSESDNKINAVIKDIFSDKLVNSLENKDTKHSEKKADEGIASVDLSTAIALINRYCGKLPSDTFTRLAPQWWMEEVQLPVKNSSGTRTAYICTLRLPLNCPVKYNIVGHPMPTKALARRMVALQACRILHRSGELDNQLMPIGKENFKAAELDNTGNFDSSDVNDSARPGTTKRRQYYYKRTAMAFTDCQPIVDTTDTEIEQPRMEKLEEEVHTDAVKKPGTKRNMLYAIVSKLWCALPERYNTRGRRLHAPQNASQAIGILMAREEPDSLQIPAFPVYTRSGEVRVSVEHVPGADVRVSPARGRLVRRFMRFVFAEVLRVRRRGMKLQSEGSTHNNYYIVPTVKTVREDGTMKVDIDWAFLELIYQHTEDKKSSEVERPNLWQNDEEEEELSASQVKEKEKKSGEVKKMENPLLKEGETFVFDADKYREAVVTPWYRNQDQPQFFLVAEICWNLSPDSAFPSALHTTFRQYYLVKYGVSLTQTDQPLLDVDHTSNRLNLLTPRYVNRKGVALPVSSERTRRAKRDRLDQKQILVPELCRVHPFAAPLWFATVALPCVLYRINALLIADEIRRSVAIDVGLGIPKIDERTCPGFQWPPLDFGWSLAEVLSADSEKNEKKKEEEDAFNKEDAYTSEIEDKEERQEGDLEEMPQEQKKEKTINDILQEKEAESGFEIGTWSNEMASSIPQDEEYDEYMEPLPPNLTFCTSASGGTNWCDPIEKPKSQYQPSHKYNMADSDCSYMSSDFDTDDSDLNSEVSDEEDTSGFCSSRNSNVAMGVRIEYKTAHEAEAVDVERKKKVNPAPQPDEEDDALDRRSHEEFIKAGEAPQEYIEKFRQSVAEHKKDIVQNGFLINHDEPLVDILPEPTKESHAKFSRELLEKTEVDLRNMIKEDKEERVVVNKNAIVNDKSEIYNIIQVETQAKPLENDVKAQEKTDKELEEIANQLSKIDFKPDSFTTNIINEIFPYGDTNLKLTDDNGQISLENIEKNKRLLLATLKDSLNPEDVKKLNCFSMKDVDIDSPNYVNEKIANVGFDKKENHMEKVNKWRNPDEHKPYYLEGKVQGKDFDFDYQPDLEGHPGPSPSVILQALTMSNANDGINLERLETIGDSFLKFAITAYLYCAHPTVHEGKLSHMRSKQVSNLNLYRLGRNKRLGARMIASKFEPHDNWLPPCHKPPSTLHPRMNERDDHLPPNPETQPDNTGCYIPYNLITQHSIPDKSIADCVEALIGAYLLECGPRGALLLMCWLGIRVLPRHDAPLSADHPHVVAESMRRERPEPTPPPPRRRECSDSEPDSSDSEGPSDEPAELGPEPDWSWRARPVGSLRPRRDVRGRWHQTVFGELKAPPSPLLRYIEDPEGELERMLSGYDSLERTLQYRFKDRSLLLQALTHASHQQNRLTDCYQRLEFLGDAILDYLITRHLYEDPRRHSPGALTDLRSALVNNTIFATLAARHGFHKYFRHMSPGLNEVLAKYVRIQEENGHSISEETSDTNNTIFATLTARHGFHKYFRHMSPGLNEVLAKYVRIQEENGHSISEEHYLIQEDEMEQAEDVEVPKALGDLFESVAGAIFLDSGMSLSAVWSSYVTLMGAELEAFSAAAPKSPVRELLEAEPDTAKFGKPERLADGRRVRVCVEVFGRGAFKGVGRNYRIAKGTAARCALRHLKVHRPR